MSERIICYQNSQFQTGFKAAESEGDQPAELRDVTHIQELTPYGLLLVSLASCTAIVLNTFSQNHAIPLQSVTIDCQYDRVFAEDCKNCDETTHYEQIIREKLEFEGDLTDEQRKILHQVAKACSIRRMVETGIQIESD